MDLTLRERILATLSYADIFAYPLTPVELKVWLIAKTVKRNLSLSSYAEVVESRRLPNGQTYLFLKGKEGILAERSRREDWSKNKWKIVRSVSHWLKCIPSLKLIGVTGGLSLNNTSETDDIDLFFIVVSGTMWISRLLVIILTEILGVRRRPGQTEIKDKICLNMFMSETSLAVTPQERDLFAAHEVLQMRSLWERDQAYSKFLQANRWVKEFLPMAWETQNSKLKVQNHNVKCKSASRFTDLVLRFEIWVLRLFEKSSASIQLKYMARHRSTEVISAGVLRFHPRDARVWVKDKLASRMARYKIPLDKVFYAQ